MCSIVFYKPIFGEIFDIFIFYCGFTISFTYFYEYILKNEKT